MLLLDLGICPGRDERWMAVAIRVLARAVCPVCGWAHDFGLRVVTRALVCEGEETQLQAQVETDEVIPGHVCSVTVPGEDEVATEPRFVDEGEKADAGLADGAS